MDIRELRIGNIVTWGKTTDIVVGISSDEVNGDFIQCETFHAERSIEEFDPVPLTEEWLLKFGFYHRDVSSSVYMMDISDDEQRLRSTLQWWVGTDHISVCRSGINAKSSPVKYVHQLQNLYFALTGEELTIKSI